MSQSDPTPSSSATTTFDGRGVHNPQIQQARDEKEKDMFRNIAAQKRHLLPKLTRSQLMVHFPFRAACEHFESKSRDYNEEFQTLWTEECQMVRSSATRRKLGELLTSFDEIAMQLTKHIVEGGDALGNNNIRPLHGYSDCYKQGNLFIRQWTDPVLAHNQQACYKAMFTTKCPNLHLPLISTHTYCGQVVTVQALIPLSRESKKLYRGDGVADMPMVKPVHHFVRRLLEALNVELIDIQGQIKQPGIEVVEGLDGRWYVISAYGLLPPLFPEFENSPKKRLEHVVASSTLLEYDAGLTEQYETMSAAFCDFLPRFVASSQLNDQSKDIQRQQKLVELLHYCSLNVSMMGIVASAVINNEMEDRESTQAVLTMMAVEMISRGAKSVMFQEMRENRVGCDIEIIRKYLKRTLGALMEDGGAGKNSRFRQVLVPHLAAKFTFSLSNSRLIRVLVNTLINDRVKIVKRLCNLCGLVLSKGVIEEAKCLPSKRNLAPTLASMTMAEATGAMLSDERDDYLTEEFLVSFGLPQRAALHTIEENLPAAISICRQVMSARCNFSKKSFLYFDALIDTATLLEANTDLEGAETLYNCALDAFCRTPLLAEDTEASFSLRQDVLTFIPGRIAVRCHLGRLRIKQDRLLDARKNFLDALELLRKLPSTITQHSSHITLAPYKGFLDIAEHPQGDAIVEIKELHQQLSVSAMCLRPSAQVFSVLDRLGSLLLQREMYPEAAECLRDACEVCRSCFGNLSKELAQALNSVAFVYYTWNVVEYGDMCEELMQESLAITEKVSGTYSMDHLCAINNLGNLLLARKRWAPASKLFAVTLAAPEVIAIRQNNPIIDSMEKSMAVLRMRFRSIAVVQMQMYWRRYKRRKAESMQVAAPAMIIQRVGRGYLSRVRRDVHSPTMARKITAFFNSAVKNTDSVSSSILRASLTPSQNSRDWNEEFQVLLEDRCIDVTNAAERNAKIMKLRDTFLAAAEEAAKATASLIDGTASPADDVRAEFVVGETNTYRVGNLIVSNEHSRQMQLVQLKGYQDLYRVAVPFLCIPLVCVLEVGDKSFMVSTLFPRTRDIVLSYRDDGEMDGIVSEFAQFLVKQALKHLNVPPTNTHGDGKYWKQVGVEVIEGADGRFYVTNAAGFNPSQWMVSAVDIEVPDTQVIHPPELNSNIHPALRSTLEAEQGDFESAIYGIEKHIVTCGKESGRRSLEVSLLLFQLYVIYDACGRRSEAIKALRQSNEVFWNTQKDNYIAVTIKVKLGELLLKHIGPAQAFTSFSEAASIMRDMPTLAPLHWSHIRLKPYYGLLECDRAGLSNINLSQLGAGVMAILTKCWSNQEVLNYLNDIATDVLAKNEFHVATLLYHEASKHARNMYGVRSAEYAKALSSEGFVYFKWGPRKHAEKCTYLMNQATNILRDVCPDSPQVGSMLNNLGCLQMQLSEYGPARMTFEEAEKILMLHYKKDHTEVLKLKKNRRVLKNRVRVAAIIRMQAFVRGWRHRRRQRLGSDVPQYNIPAEFIINERELRKQLFEEYYAGAQEVWWKCRKSTLFSVEMAARISLAQNQQVHFHTIQQQQRTLAFRVARLTNQQRLQHACDREAEKRDELEREWMQEIVVFHQEPIGRMEIEETQLAEYITACSGFIEDTESIERTDVVVQANIEVGANFFIDQFQLHGHKEYLLYSLGFLHLLQDIESSERGLIRHDAVRTKSALGAQFAEEGNAVLKEIRRKAKEKKKQQKRAEKLRAEAEAAEKAEATARETKSADTTNESTDGVDQPATLQSESSQSRVSHPDSASSMRTGSMSQMSGTTTGNAASTNTELASNSKLLNSLSELQTQNTFAESTTPTISEGEDSQEPHLHHEPTPELDEAAKARIEKLLEEVSMEEEEGRRHIRADESTTWSLAEDVLEVVTLEDTRREKILERESNLRTDVIEVDFRLNCPTVLGSPTHPIPTHGTVQTRFTSPNDANEASGYSIATAVPPGGSCDSTNVPSDHEQSLRSGVEQLPSSDDPQNASSQLTQNDEALPFTGSKPPLGPHDLTDPLPQVREQPPAPIKLPRRTSSSTGEQLLVNENDGAWAMPKNDTVDYPADDALSIDSADYRSRSRSKSNSSVSVSRERATESPVSQQSEADEKKPTDEPVTVEEVTREPLEQQPSHLDEDEDSVRRGAAIEPAADPTTPTIAVTAHHHSDEVDNNNVSYQQLKYSESTAFSDTHELSTISSDPRKLSHTLPNENGNDTSTPTTPLPRTESAVVPQTPTIDQESTAPTAQSQVTADEFPGESHALETQPAEVVVPPTTVDPITKTTPLADSREMSAAKHALNSDQDDPPSASETCAPTPLDPASGLAPGIPLLPPASPPGSPAEVPDHTAADATDEEVDDLLAVPDTARPPAEEPVDTAPRPAPPSEDGPHDENVPPTIEVQNATLDEIEPQGDEGPQVRKESSQPEVQHDDNTVPEVPVNVEIPTAQPLGLSPQGMEQVEEQHATAAELLLTEHSAECTTSYLTLIEEAQWEQILKKEFIAQALNARGAQPTDEEDSSRVDSPDPLSDSMRRRALPTQILKLLVSQEMDRREGLIQKERSAFVHIVAAIRRYAQNVYQQHHNAKQEGEERRRNAQYDREALVDEETFKRKAVTDDHAFAWSNFLRSHRTGLAKALKKEKARKKKTAAARKEKRREAREARKQQVAEQHAPAPPSIPAPPSGSRPSSAVGGAMRDRDSTPHVVEGDELLPMFGGFRCDDLMLSVLQYEAQLVAIKSNLQDREVEVKKEIDAIGDERLLLLEGHAAWVPARPGSAHSVDYLHKGRRHPSAAFAQSQTTIKERVARETAWNASTSTAQQRDTERMAQDIASYGPSMMRTSTYQNHRKKMVRSGSARRGNSSPAPPRVASRPGSAYVPAGSKRR